MSWRREQDDDKKPMEGSQWNLLLGGSNETSARISIGRDACRCWALGVLK